MSAYYIYKYVVDGQIVYIGQSINLKNRIAQHKRDKLKNLSSAKIYYFECPNKTAMNSWEYFLINKYHPIYNSALKDTDVIAQMREPEWILYKEENFPTKKKEKEKINHKITEINLNTLITPLISSSSDIKYHFYDTDLMEEKLIIYLLIKSKIQNTSLSDITGNIPEYLRFCSCVDSGNMYRAIKNICKKSNYISKSESSSEFYLSPNGINLLDNFIELDLDYLAGIIKYCNHKYTCFIIDALLQTNDYILYVDDLKPYLPPSFGRNFYDLSKRVVYPAVEEAKLFGFLSGCVPKKTGNKYTSIEFQ